MADILGNALSGLISHQRALATTSHNISNANTDGYSRQVVNFQTRQPETYGGFTIGSGVKISSINRAYDRFAVDQERRTGASYEHQKALNQLSSRVDVLLSDPKQGLAPALSDFFDAVQSVSSDPSSIAARREFISAGESMTQRFRNIDTEMGLLTRELNNRLSFTVDEINGLTNRIAEINFSISRQAGSGGAPNDLLDARDSAVLQLNNLVRVSTVEQSDGTLSVFVGNGQSLVLGNKALPLLVTPGKFDPTRPDVGFAGSGNITNTLEGGALGGMLAFRSEVLEPAQNQLGLIATQLASLYNDQHKAGVDLRGDPGVDLFAIPDPFVAKATGNTGTAVVTATLGDVSKLTGDSYAIRFDGTNWQLRNAGTSEVMGTFDATGLNTKLQSLGVSYTVTGTPAVSDEFVIQPTARTTANMRMAFTDPALVAAAVDDASSGPGDNRNMLLLAGLEQQRPMAGGTETFYEGALNLVSRVATAARSAEVAEKSHATLLEQANSRRLQASGVNLDEEAAQMLRFQQAYQASAQVASTAQTLFQTILNAFQ